jgi:uncharacterized protein
MSQSAMPNSRRADAVAMLAAALFPMFAAWLYFVALAGSPSAIQQTAYLAGKILQFGFPVVWVIAMRQWPRWKWPNAMGLIEGLVFGAVISGVMIGAYYGLLRNSSLFAEMPKLVAEKITGFGVDSLSKYIALGVFYCVFHSLLEEYYWRWFLFGGLRRLMPLWPAIILSSLAFMGHHVIVLAVYFGGFSMPTVLFSLCVAIGGAAWAWTYHRSQSLIGPWLSHLLVDAAIFIVGYDLVRSVTGW